MEENKVKLYQKWWFWLCIALVVFVILIIVLTNDDTTPSSNTGVTYFDTSKQNGNNKTSKTATKENVKIEYAGMTKDGDFVIRVINNNNVPIHISEISTVYKNSDDIFMLKETSDEKYFGIEANSEVYVRNWGYEKDYSQYPKYEFDFNFSGSWVAEDSVIGNYEIKANNTGNNIAVEIKNNNNVSIEDIQIGVVFYSNGEIVGYTNGYDFDNMTSAGSSAYINAPYPEDNNYKEVSFDTYNVYVLNAEKAD